MCHTWNLGHFPLIPGNFFVVHFMLSLSDPAQSLRVAHSVLSVCPWPLDEPNTPPHQHTHAHNPVLCVVPSRLTYPSLALPSTRAHPGVNLDHDDNYCLGVQPVGGEEWGTRIVHSGRSQISSSTRWPWRERWGREEGEGGSRADPGISILTEFQHCRSLSAFSYSCPQVCRWETSRAGVRRSTKQILLTDEKQRIQHRIQEHVWVPCFQLTECVSVCHMAWQRRSLPRMSFHHALCYCN